MNEFNNIIELIIKEKNKARCLIEFLEVLKSRNDVINLGQGQLKAGEAFHTFNLRYASVNKASIDCCGFSETLSMLEKMPAEESIKLFHFAIPEKIFTVFVAINKYTVLGCISVTKGVSET